jgi:hypothetical protein
MGRLGHSGSPIPLRRELFPLGFAGEVMQLAAETWRAFAMHREVRLEPRITALFRDALIEAYDAAGRSWFITLEDPITDPIFGTEEGRNDLNFYPPRHHGQTVFFTMECKRLHVQTSSGFAHKADQYVTEGVQRFVDGQYSTGLPCGGMLGYVMDNKVAAAFRRVEGELAARRAKLKISGKPIWKTPSVTLPASAESADTAHTRGDGSFALHHLLVGVTQ